MIFDALKITHQGRDWWIQAFTDDKGLLEAVNLYDENGDFVDEYPDFIAIYNAITKTNLSRKEQTQ